MVKIWSPVLFYFVRKQAICLNRIQEENHFIKREYTVRECWKSRKSKGKERMLYGSAGKEQSLLSDSWKGTDV